MHLTDSDYDMTTPSGVDSNKQAGTLCLPMQECKTAPNKLVATSGEQMRGLEEKTIPLVAKPDTSMQKVVRRGAGWKEQWSSWMWTTTKCTQRTCRFSRWIKSSFQLSGTVGGQTAFRQACQTRSSGVQRWRTTNQACWRNWRTRVELSCFAFMLYMVVMRLLLIFSFTWLLFLRLICLIPFAKKKNWMELKKGIVQITPHRTHTRARFLAAHATCDYTFGSRGLDDSLCV